MNDYITEFDARERALKFENNMQRPYSAIEPNTDLRLLCTRVIL